MSNLIRLLGALFCLLFNLAGCGFAAPAWFNYMEDSRRACQRGDIAASDAAMASALIEAKKYKMNPPAYYGMSPYSPATLAGELATLAGHYSSENNCEKAASLCEQSVAISPRYRFLLASIYDDQGKHAKAEQIYLDLLNEAQKSVTKDRNNGDNLRNLGGAMSDLAGHYQTIGELTKAEEFYEKDLAITQEVYPGSNVSYDTTRLGKLCLKLGNLEKAKKFFELALSFNESSRTVRDRTGRHGASKELSNLADVYAAEQKFAKAEAFYQEALQEPLGFYDTPTEEEVMCRRNYAKLLARLNRPTESRAMNVSAQDLERALEKKQYGKRTTAPIIYE